MTEEQVIDIPELIVLEPGKTYRIGGELYLAEAVEPYHGCDRCAFGETSDKCLRFDCAPENVILKKI